MLLLWSISACLSSTLGWLIWIVAQHGVSVHPSWKAWQLQALDGNYSCLGNLVVELVQPNSEVNKIVQM